MADLAGTCVLYSKIVQICDRAICKDGRNVYESDGVVWHGTIIRAFLKTGCCVDDTLQGRQTTHAAREKHIRAIECVHEAVVTHGQFASQQGDADVLTRVLPLTYPCIPC